MFDPLLQMFDGVGLSDALAQSPLLALGTLFGAGLVTSLTPCVYPMIPITASVLAATAGENASRSRVISLTFTYALGLAMLYAMLGLVAGMSGTLFGTISANPWVRLAMGNLLLVFGLAMFDVIPVPVPQRLLQWAASRKGGSYPSVFLAGAASGIVAAPCGAPAFFVVLTWVASTQAGAMGFLYLFVFSFGMTALLVAVGLFSGFGTALPASGQWMVWIKKGAGVIMMVMAQYYFVQVGMVL